VTFGAVKFGVAPTPNTAVTALREMAGLGPSVHRVQTTVVLHFLDSLAIDSMKLNKTHRTRKAMAELPGKVLGPDSTSHLEEDECRKCNFNKGVIALRPCGHALYCKACVNKLRSDSIIKGRLSKCLRKSCVSLVVGWVVLCNVNKGA